MTWNSISIMANVFMAGGLGYLFWFVAGRLFPAHDVGLVSALVAAVGLCSQGALLGMGSAVITLLGHRALVASLLSTAFAIVAVSGFVIAAILILGVFPHARHFGDLNSTIVLRLAFVATGAIWAVSLLADQVFVGLRRADRTVLRSTVAGLAKVMALILLVLWLPVPGPSRIFLAWTLGALTACIMGVFQLRRAAPSLAIFRTPDTAGIGKLFRLGLPYHGLTLSVMAPGLVFPVVVAGFLSPTWNAYWYIVWIMAGLVLIIPSSNALALFAEAAGASSALGQHVREMIVRSMAMGLPVVAVAVLLARPVLGLVGSAYASHGTAPLRLLVFSLLPVTFIEAYLAVCRARGHLFEGFFAAAVTAVLTIGTGIAAALTLGLTGLAASILVIQSGAGIWAAYRLQDLASVRRAGVHP